MTAERAVKWGKDKKLIKDLRQWYNRKHGEIDSGVTHGAWGLQPVPNKRIEDGNCPVCTHQEETPEQLRDECPRWEQKRPRLQRSLGWRVSYCGLDAGEGDHRWATNSTIRKEMQPDT